LKQIYKLFLLLGLVFLTFFQLAFRFNDSFNQTLAPTTTTPQVCQSLSSIGPWLVLSKTVTNNTANFLVMNADGTCQQPIGLPSLPEDRIWFVLPQSINSFLAFRSTSSSYHPMDVRMDEFDPFIWILKLPENRIVQKIPLFSETSSGLIRDLEEKAIESEMGLLDIPTQIGLAQNPDSYVWSPDGRYLAYSAGTSLKSTDLYVYDTEKNETCRLTNGKTGAQAWFWNPDGSTIFYRNGSATSIDFAAPELSNMDGVFAVDLKNGERFLYDPETTWELVGGITDETFFVSNYGFETSPWNIRLVNYKTSKVQIVFPEKFTQFAADYTGTPLFLLFYNHFFGSFFDKTPGIYKISPETKSLAFSNLGEARLEYDKNLDLFITGEIEKDRKHNLIFFDRNGKEQFSIPDSFRYKSSQDGKLLLAWGDGPMSLFTSSGDAIRQFNIDKVEWNETSTGFWGASNGDSIFYFGQQEDWHPQKIYFGEVYSFEVVNKKEP
jgi:hypothetical protein